ncbi:S1 RNA-binding domain-containing protein [Photobacterium leiognathi]|uniref:S1 RNA-binding domain-containing protein n=1 Tax=Photobacterium leiognathi TaxID=553611 RepID=UPI0029820C78|nr:S1 RNA-binding domain-containing protein [Photobacterium leiognathi]
MYTFQIEETGHKDNFSDLLSSFPLPPVIKEHTIVDVVVVSVDKKIVTVNGPFRCEGTIKLADFDQKPSVGDTVKAFVYRVDDGINGQPILSHYKARLETDFEHLRAAINSNETVEGVIEEVAYGNRGLMVRVGTQTGFLPATLAFDYNCNFAEMASSLVGEKTPLKVTGINLEKENFIFNRKKALVEENGDLDTLRDKIVRGNRLKGRVTNIKNYGIFIDLGGIDGMCHVSDLAWCVNKANPQKYKIGQEIDVFVRDFDENKEKITLSLKHLDRTDWAGFTSNYNVNDVVECEVNDISLKRGMIFVSINNQVNGMIHIRDVIGTDAPLKEVYNHIETDQKLNAVITGIDQTLGRESVVLSVQSIIGKERLERFAQNNKVSDKIKGRISNIRNNLVFMEFDEEGLEALLPIGEMSWTEQDENFVKTLSVGDEHEVVIQKLDPQNNKFVVSLKRAKKSPQMLYPNGTKLNALVHHFDRNDNLHLTLADGDIEIFCPKNYIVNKSQYRTNSLLSRGMEVEVTVRQVKNRNQRLTIVASLDESIFDDVNTKNAVIMNTALKDAMNTAQQ